MASRAQVTGKITDARARRILRRLGWSLTNLLSRLSLPFADFADNEHNCALPNSPIRLSPASPPPTHQFLLAEFRSAALVAIAYVTFVVVGSMIFKVSSAGSGEGRPPPPPSP